MFEIHMTVSSKDVELFKKACSEFGCKTVLIELQNTSSSYQQLMTSQKFAHKDWDTEIQRTKEFFADKFPIERIKVEINPYAYTDASIKYYETHFRIISDSIKAPKLDSLIKAFGFHRSKNVLKTLNDTEYFQMATYRTYDLCLTNFEEVIQKFKDALTNANLVYDKVEVEACVIDTNDGLDSKWLK